MTQEKQKKPLTKEINMDGVHGRIRGIMWIAHGFVSLEVFDEGQKNHPYPSGRVAGYTIPLKQLEDALEELR